MNKRIEKINQLIKKELSKIILEKIEFPQNALATLTRVETTKDLKEGKIFVSVWPEIKSEEVLKILKKNIYFLQQNLNNKFKIKRVPKIIFLKEKKVAEAGRIDEVLEKLKH